MNSQNAERSGSGEPLVQRAAARLHSPATTVAFAVDDAVYASKTVLTYYPSPIRKTITHPINGENIFRFTRVDLNFPTYVFNVGINRAFIGFECNPMDHIEQLRPIIYSPG